MGGKENIMREVVMDNTIEGLRNKAGIRSNWEILQKTHNAILFLNKNVKFRIFPIYIQYVLDEKLIAILYYKGKFVNSDEIDLGLCLNLPPALKELGNAEHMKYANINYSCILRSTKNIDKFLHKIISLMHENAK